MNELRAFCDHRLKATYLDKNGDEQTIYGISQDGVIRELESLGVREFSLTRPSLEDVYLQLTAEKPEAVAC
jgi:hypothetical protein